MRVKEPISLSQYHPQSNLPNYKILSSLELKLSRNIVRKLLSEIKRKNVKRYKLGSELNLNGYGIADLVLLEYWSVKNLKRLSQKKFLTVFEIKIRDWRKALKQAYRYKYYSHKSIVILPDYNSNRAISQIKVFESLGIGLWLYNEENDSFLKVYTPRIHKPFSKLAYQKALSMLN